MRCFLEYKEGKVVGWLTKNTNPTYGGLTEVEPQEFKSELKKIGVEYILEEVVVQEVIDLEKVAMSEAIIDLNVQIEIMKEQINKLNGGI